MWNSKTPNKAENLFASVLAPRFLIKLLGSFLVVPFSAWPSLDFVVKFTM